MTRPAVIIGLGGTGEWVATYVKKDLQEIGKGKLPANVRLLAFDLTPHGEADVKGAGAAVTGSDVRGQKRARVGQIALVKDVEFIDLGGNIYDLSQKIAQEEQRSGPDQVLRHLGSWFQAADYLSAMMPADFDLCLGAGQIRQFGRMAVFEDLAHGKSHLSVRIKRAIDELQADVLNTNTQLEVVIVASFAGGTGAGMLIDVANLARKCARDAIHTNYVLRAFIVLPDAFPWADDGMRARAYAAWRELDRFMLIDREVGLGLEDIRYREDLRIPIETWPFDAVYLVGAERPKHSLQNIVPEEAVFPAVADAISAILDGVAGTRFTTLAANLRPLRLQRGKQDTPMYSSIAAYTIKAPVYYAEEVFTHQLALNVLAVLAPVVTDVGGVEARLKPDARLDKPREAGATEVSVFLDNQPVTADEVSVSNTAFTPRMRQILSTSGTERQQQVSYYAQYAGDEGMGASAVLSAFTTSLPDSVAQAREEIDHTCTVQVMQEVLPSWDQGDRTVEAVSRYDQKDEGGIDHFTRRYYGYLLDDGTDYRGLLGDNLGVCKKVQMDLLRRRLQVWLQGALKGDSSDARRDLSGRLGYAADFLRELQARFSEFEGFVADVVRERSRLGLYSGAQAAKDARHEYLVNHPSTRRVSELGPWGWVVGILVLVLIAAGAVALFVLNPLMWWIPILACVLILALGLFGLSRRDNRMAEKAYLDAVQDWVNERKADIIYNVVTETLGEMKSVCSQAATQVRRWGTALVLGDAQRQVEALQTHLQKELNGVKANQAADQNLGRLQRQVAIGADPTADDENAVLESLGWEVRPDLSFGCTVQQPDGTAQVMALGSDGVVDGTPLLDAAARQFSPLLAGHQIAVYLGRSQKARDLAAELQDRAEPLYRVAPAYNGPLPLGSTYLVRANHQIDQPTLEFFNRESAAQNEWGVVQWLRGTLARDVELVGSEDDYKLTAVCTHDLMESARFAQYQNCRDAYIAYIQRLAEATPEVRNRERERMRMAKRLHLFPSLVNAIEYEVRLMADQNATYRPLHTKVVAVLEDKERVRQFFLLQAYGFIAQVVAADGVERWYELQLPGRDPLYLTPPRPGLPDIFRAVNTFAIVRKDARPNSTAPIVEQAVEEAIQQTQRDLVDAVYRLRRAMDMDVVAPMIASPDDALRDLGHLARLIYKEWIGHLRISSPQVVGLLELEGTARRRVDQFFACLAYGIVSEVRRASERWYQLTTPRQSIYLCVPRVGEPDALMAIANFADPRGGKDTRNTGAGSQAPINFAEVEQELARHEQNLARAIRGIQHQREADDGIANRLRGASDLELRHLSRLAQLVYQEAYDRLLGVSAKMARVLGYDRRDLVNDFFRCCAYGLISLESDRQSRDQWLQLSWPGHTLCLTKPQQGGPDFFVAIDTLVVLGEDVRGWSGGQRADKIDYERIGQLLRSRESKLVETLQRLQEPLHWNNPLWKAALAGDAEHGYLRQLAELVYEQQASLLAMGSPRVADLVKEQNRERVGVFFGCYAHGLVTKVAERNRQWYQLRFSHPSQGAQDIRLTEPVSGEPEIMKAAEAYVKGEGVARERTSEQPEVRYELVAEALQTVGQADPVLAAQQLDREMNDEDGLVKRLQGGNPDERYLADLVYQVLSERKQALG